jgi:uncharacterized protein with PIN domain
VFRNLSFKLDVGEDMKEKVKLKEAKLDPKNDFNNPKCPDCGINLVKVFLELPEDRSDRYFVYQCRSCKKIFYQSN